MKLQGRDNRGRSAERTPAPPRPRQREFARSDDGALLVLGCLFILVGSVGWFSAARFATPNLGAAAATLHGPATGVPALGVLATWLVGAGLIVAALRARRVHRNPTPLASGSGAVDSAKAKPGGCIAVDWDRAVDGWLVIHADSLGRDTFACGDVARALSAAGSLARSCGARLKICGGEPGQLQVVAGAASGGRRTVPAPASLRRATWAMAAVATLTTAQLTSVLLTHLSAAAGGSFSIALVVGVGVVLGVISLALATKHTVLELSVAAPVEPRVELQVDKRALGICWQRRRFAAGAWVHPLVDTERQSGLLWLCSPEHSLVVATTCGAAEELGRWLQGNAASTPSLSEQAFGLTPSPLMSNDE